MRTAGLLPIAAVPFPARVLLVGFVRFPLSTARICPLPKSHSPLLVGLLRLFRWNAAIRPASVTESPGLSRMRRQRRSKSVESVKSAEPQSRRARSAL
ncbi:hypothetical protein BISU_2219 [Bifidobacterium subtile]|uniref:Uncharacterized protein n=1 Tax=Bifidobacterium subtile TaxID=77635 RepID=A0A087DU18_9BIFI|nr:hypothetical protein BISU_2219 [Bifidobacterium subtile]